MLTFKQAETLFKSARCKTAGKPLPGRLGSTRLIRIDENTFGIRLHSTVVVAINRDGSYMVKTGGWCTPTTHERICLYSPVMPFGGASYRAGRSFVRSPKTGETFEITSQPAFIRPDGSIKGILVDYQAECKAYASQRRKELKARKLAEEIRRNPHLATPLGRAVEGRRPFPKGEGVPNAQS